MWNLLEALSLGSILLATFFSRSTCSIDYESDKKKLAPLALSRLYGSCIGLDENPRCKHLRTIWKGKASSSVYRVKLNTVGYSPLASINYYPWDYIVEPHKKTVLSVPDLLIEDQRRYEWAVYKVIENDNTEFLVQLEGETVEYVFTIPTQMYYVTLKVFHFGGHLVDIVHANMICKYVRREIRSLSENDRQDFFRALSHFSKGSTDAIPGNSVLDAESKTLQYTMSKHIHTQSCSPFHNGNGFITSHAAFTLEVDQALQSYMPQVIVPYWDYTIDAKLYGNDWYLDSPLFKNDWFGAATPSNGDYHISSKWFESIDMPMNFNSPVHNSYGIITNSINNDGSGKVSRAHSFCEMENRIPLPTCNEMKGCLKTKTLGEFRDCMEGQLHRDLHMGIGGMWKCGVNLQSFLDTHPDSEHILAKLCIQIMSVSNALWQSGDLVCPEYCAPDVAFEDCRCTCPAYHKQQLESIAWEEAYFVLQHAGVVKNLKKFLQTKNDEEGMDSYTAFDDDHVIYVVENEKNIGGGALNLMNNGASMELSHAFNNLSRVTNSRQEIPMWLDISTESSRDLWKLLLQLGCTPGIIGTMGTGASSGDPIFWPIHPLYDRLVSYVHLNIDGQFDEMDWKWEDDPNECEGHRSYDAMPFSRLFGEPIDDAYHFYSNAELMQHFDPKNPKLPYVYDSFEWQHCA